MTPDDLIARLLEIEVSALCDADKGLPVLDPAIRAMVADVLPVFACGTVPASGTTLSRAAVGQRVRCGGVDVAAGDIVFGDDDGVVIASRDRIVAALDGGEAIARAERALLAAMADGRALHDLTNYADHARHLDAGETSGLQFRVD